MEPREGVKVVVAFGGRILPTAPRVSLLKFVGLIPVRTCPYSAPVACFPHGNLCPPGSFDRRVRFSLLVFSRFLFVVKWMSSVVFVAILAIRGVRGILPS